MLFASVHDFIDSFPDAATAPKVTQVVAVEYDDSLPDENEGEPVFASLLQQMPVQHSRVLTESPKDSEPTQDFVKHDNWLPEQDIICYDDEYASYVLNVGWVCNANSPTPITYDGIEFNTEEDKQVYVTLLYQEQAPAPFRPTYHLEILP